MCSTPLDLNVNFGVGGIYLSDNPKFSIYECGELSFAYSFVKKYLVPAEALNRDFIDVFRKRFDRIMQDVKLDSSKSAEACLLAIIHCLKNLLAKFPIRNFELLEQMI